MATERKLQPRRLQLKSNCKETSCKKGSEGCGKAYRTREERPIWQTMRDAIKGHDHALWKLGQLTNNGKQTLSDFANGYSISDCIRLPVDGCSVSGHLMLQTSI